MKNKDKKIDFRKSYESKLIEKILGSDDEDSSKIPQFRFQISIDIGDGKKGIISINQQSDPFNSALQFCKQYNLDVIVAGRLCQSIREIIQNDKNSYILETELKSMELINKSKKLSQQYTSTTLDKNKNQQRKQQIRNSKQNQKNSSVNKSLQKSKQKDEYTYKPKLNQISRLITQKRGLKNILEEIDLNKRKKEQKMDKIKQQLHDRQIQQCSFQPKINLKSSRIVQENIKQESQKRYQYLYLLHQKNKSNSRNGSKQNFTFKPEINNMSKSIVSGLTFQQRQQKFRQKRSEANNTTVNPTVIHKPKTGRKPASRNKDKLPIGQYLHNEGKRKSFDFSSEYPTQIKSVMLQKSSDIVKQKQQKKLKQIFEILDKNKDGIISHSQINLQQTNIEIYNIFKPIIDEMKLLDIQLNCEEFIQAGNGLIATLSISDKNKILDTKKKTQYKYDKQCTFKPKINHSNQKIQSVDIYKRSIIKKQKQIQKLQKSKEDRIRKQITQCTFKPKIKQYKNLVYSTNII